MIRATNVANHGATVAELEAIFGWGGHMASLYTPSANRRALRAGAMKKHLLPHLMTRVAATAKKPKDFIAIF